MSVIFEKNIDAKMRDGTVLRADVYRPAADGRYPVLVLRTPYNKEFWPFTFAAMDPTKAANAGYAVILQDVRARWASDGDGFFLYRDEYEDGYDTIEWAAGLPFSDGNVGAYGISYMGSTPLQAAATAPPSLKAIAPTTAPFDFFKDHLWRGGALLWGTLVAWALQAIGPAAHMRSKLGSDDFMPQLLQLVDDIDDYDKWLRHVPLNNFPPARPDDPSFLPFFFEILKHPTRDDFNKSIIDSDRVENVAVPTQVIAGWNDLLLAPDLDLFKTLRSRGATEEAREKSRLIVGPWSHGAFLNVVGEVDFGMRSSGFFLDLKEDLTALHLRWFDRWLKGIRTGIDEEPPVKIFVQGLNRWRDEDDWPLARARNTTWFLRAGGGFGPDSPGDDRPASYVYDPEDPCITRGGTLLLPGSYPRGPVDQGPVLTRKDVLVYTSEVLHEDMEVTGPVSAVLYAATSAPDTDWVVKLCDVHPDGRTLNVCDGILRARYRDSMESPTLVEPNTVNEYEIDLWATSMVFKAGHRLRVIVTSSDFPRYDRNPNTGKLSIDSTEMTPALQTIFHDANRASHLVLPVIPTQ